MTRQTMRIVLASGVMIAVGLAGVATAKSTTTTKTADRLPLTLESEMAPEAPLDRLAALDGMPPAGPWGGPFAGPEGAGGPPPPEGPPHGRPPFGHPFGPLAGPGGAPGPGMAGGPHHRPCPDPLMFARNLAAAEVAVGIRADQLDAWRAFTDALLAAAPPPPLPGPPPGAPPGPAGHRPADAAGKPGTPPDALTGVEALAARLKDEGEAGARLAEATQALRTRLSPDQLQRMARLGPALMPPPPFGGPPPRRPGPGEEGPPKMP